MFIRELHQLVVSDLKHEGDKTPGAFRSNNVRIANSAHCPPEQHLVLGYMEELLSFINSKQPDKYDLLKTAIAHHRFAWIHPFSNGNGRVVRLLNYALLIKYGFNVKQEKLLNPNAVFCNNRNDYYSHLAQADTGKTTDILCWCEYVLGGLIEEISKVDKLLDSDFVFSRILQPTIKHGIQAGHLDSKAAIILEQGAKLQCFKNKDLSALNMSERQITYQLSKLKAAGLIAPMENKERFYRVNFVNNQLMRGLIAALSEHGFITLNTD